MKGMDMRLDQKIVKTPASPHPSLRTTLARWISIIIHPIAFPLLSLGIVSYAADPMHSFLGAARWVLIALLLTSVPISLLVSYMVLRGHWSDLDVSVRRQRYLLYPFGMACVIALAFVFVALGAPRIAVSATVALLLANLVDGLINLVYKVSAHATAAAMCATVLWVGAPSFGIPATIAALLVGWSRITLGRHTTGQVILGWLVGSASMLAVLAIPGHLAL
jgi:membrane-associated phospholipid phosphatase